MKQINPQKVLILGATGMLGSGVYSVLKDKYNLVLSVRDKGKIKFLNKMYGGVKKQKIIEFDVVKMYQNYLDKKGYPGEYLTNFLEGVGKIDRVINCIGVTIPHSFDNQTLTFFINGALPHLLTRIWKEKLIHFTTDCVYNGKEDFPYDENSLKTPVDLYGLSKSLGEPINCLTIRSSIIGRELEDHNNFLDWFLGQKGQTLTGFDNHFWNGITTKEAGKIFDKIISNPGKFPQTGIYHVFSTTVSKYDMLLAFREKFNIDCEIKKDTEQKLNRSLTTIHKFNSLLKSYSFKQMLADL